MEQWMYKRLAKLWGVSEKALLVNNIIPILSK